MESVLSADLQVIIQKEFSHLFICFTCIIYNKDIIESLVYLKKIGSSPSVCGSHILLDYIKWHYLNNSML